MGFLNLQALAKPKAVRVEVGEDHVFMRSLTALELVEMQKKSGNEALGAESAFDFNLQLLASVLVDSEGNQVATDSAALRHLPTELVLKTLIPAAMEVSGLSEKKSH